MKTDVLLNGDFLLLNIPSTDERALLSQYNSKLMPSSFHGFFFFGLSSASISIIAFYSGRNVFFFFNFMAVDGY